MIYPQPIQCVLVRYLSDENGRALDAVSTVLPEPRRVIIDTCGVSCTIFHKQHRERHDIFDVPHADCPVSACNETRCQRGEGKDGIYTHLRSTAKVYWVY